MSALTLAAGDLVPLATRADEFHVVPLLATRHSSQSAIVPVLFPEKWPKPPGDCGKQEVAVWDRAAEGSCCGIS